jgi:DNA-directed RNA polymerase specialized sigma24 family protein
VRFCSPSSVPDFHTWNPLEDVDREPRLYFDDPHEMASDWEMVRQALERLKEKPREALILKALGYSLDDLTQHFDMETNAVEVMLRRARAELRQICEQSS